jgi:hypothetical protein
LKFLLPEGYAELSLAVSRIPGNEFLPAHPFAGFTLNINVSTYIHRDWKDLKLCLIIVISDPDCEGGDLCFFEPGIVFELLNGDMIIFESKKYSHFNLHFKGYRSSVVFHSDSAFTLWTSQANGWKDNVNFRQSVLQPVTS